MKKDNIKKKTFTLLAIWIVLLITIPCVVLKIESNINSNNVSYLSSDFDIEKYDVVLDVDKDNKVDVTENITINIPDDNFNGIYKSIPIWQHYYNKNLEQSTKKVNITNLRAIGEKFVLYKHTDNIGIRIGSTRTNTDKGIHTYTIKYRYNMGKDPNKDFDEFVFNVFDNYDNTKINNISVTINMPDSFNENDIQFLKGKEDIKNRINYKVNGNTLYATLDDYNLDKSLTINFTLPNNYFVGGTYNYGILSLMICVAIIVISICSFFAWKKYGKNNDKRTQTVEFYPPDDLDAAQIGYIYGEENIKKLTVSLIIGLASKGYVSIEETEDKKFQIINIGKNNSKLKKLSVTEQIVYLELFKNSDTNLLYSDQSFSLAFNKVQECLNSVIDKKVNDLGSRKMMNTIFALLIGSIISWTISYLYIKDLNPNLNILYLLSFVAIFITGFFSIIMGRKTSYGEIIIAKILGFKDYLETAEKNKLDALVEENPNYFYDILPYTYVLGISKKWINTFEKTNVPNIDLNSLDLYESNFFMVM